MDTIPIKTTTKEEIIDISSQVKEAVAKSKVKEGICVIYTPHTSAGLTINENSDPDVKVDLLHGLKEIVTSMSFKHAEGNSDAHLKSALISKSHSLIINSNSLVLGPYDGIFFCEFDGPRERKVYVEILKKN